MERYYLRGRRPALAGFLFLAVVLLAWPSGQPIYSQSIDPKDRERATKQLIEPARRAMENAGLKPEQQGIFNALLVHNKFSDDNLERLECECLVHETLDLAKLDYPRFLEEKQKRYGHANAPKDAKEYVDVGGEEKAFVVDFGKGELAKGQTPKGQAWGWCRVGQVRFEIHKTRNSKTQVDPLNPPTAAVKEENVRLNAQVRQEVIDLLKKLVAALKSDEPEDDTFWKEYPKHCQFIRERYRDYDAARKEAGCTGNCLRDLRRRMKLLNGTLFNDQSATALSPEMQSRVQKKVAELGLEISAQRRQMDALQRDADMAITDIRRRLQDLDRKYGKKYRVIPESLRHYQDIYDQIPLDFAKAEGDEDSINSAITLGKNLEYSATTRLQEADELWKRGEAVKAVFVLRKALSRDPSNALVKKALAAMECDFLKASISKSQSAVAAARKEFYKYMGESGFAKHLDDGTYGSESAAITDVWAIFVTGVTRSWSAQRRSDPNAKDPQSFLEELRRGGDRPDSEARTLEATESTMLKAFKGLHAILTLHRTGRYTLADIAKLDTPGLQNALPLRNTLPDKDPLGKPYSDAQMRLVGQYIHEAMLLPDVKALMGTDADALTKAISESYWDPSDTGNTWAEWIGDLSSAFNVFMFFSGGAVAKAGALSKIGYWGQAQQEIFAGLKAAKQVTYGSEVVNGMFVWRRVMGALGMKPGTCKALTGMLQRSLDYRYGKKAGVAWKAAWTVNSAVGGMIIMHFSSELLKAGIGEEYSVPLTQAMLLFGPDTESLLKFLKDTKLPPAEISTALKTIATKAREEAVQCRSAIKDIEEIRTLFDKALTNKTLKNEEMKYLQENWGEAWKAKLQAGEVITGDPVTNAAIAANAAREATAKARKDGSVLCLQEMKKEIEEHGGALEKLAEDSTKASSRVLEEASTAVESASPIANEVFISFEPKSWRPIWNVQPGSRMARAEAALREGDFKLAKQLYEEAADLFEKEGRDLEMVILDRKIDMATELMKLQEAGELKLPQGEAVFAKPLSPEDLAAIKNGQWTAMDSKASTSQLWRSGDFILKKMNTAEGSPAFNRALEGELVTAELARELGLNVPSIALVTKDGETYIATRFIPGKDLSDASLADAFRYRDQIAQMNVLSHLLGDYDRHSSNFRIGSDANVYSLDAAGSNVRGEGWTPSELEHLQGTKDMSDTWLARHTLNATSKHTNDPDPTSLIHDLMLSNSPAVQDMTKKVHDLVKNESRLRGLVEGSFRRVYGDKFDPALVNEAVAAIQARDKTLDFVVQGWNTRNVGK